MTGPCQCDEMWQERGGSGAGEVLRAGEPGPGGGLRWAVARGREGGWGK